MTTKTFALNTELRPLLEAIAAQKGAPLWVELIPIGEQIEGRDGRSWFNDDLPIDIEHSTELKAPMAMGLAILPLLAGHVIGTRGMDLVVGIDPDYYFVVTAITITHNSGRELRVQIGQSLLEALRWSELLPGRTFAWPARRIPAPILPSLHSRASASSAKIVNERQPNPNPHGCRFHSTYKSCTLAGY